MKSFENALLSSYLRAYPEKSTLLCEKLSDDQLRELPSGMSDADVLRLLRRLKPQRAKVLLEALPVSVFPRIYRAMDPIRSALLLTLLSPEELSAKTRLLTPAEQEDLSDLQAYPPGSAASMMNTSVMVARAEDSVASVLKQIKKERSSLRYVFVVDIDGKLIGTLPVQELVFLDEKELVSNVMHRSPPHVNALSPSSEVTEAFEDYKVGVLAVTHVDGSLLGAIAHASFIEELHKQAVSAMATMSGASPSESALSKPFPAVGKRLPWLLINLLTAFIASAVVGVFENTISQVTALAILLPIVAGQSGNTGAQAMAVAMRGLALREVRVRQWFLLVYKELRVGFVNGLVVAIVTGLSVYFWSQNMALGAVMAVAMTLSMVIASMSGAAIPMILTALGKDPAQSSSVILTTVTDVMGFLSFLGLATLFVSYLL